jgi:hypothetical protein
LLIVIAVAALATAALLFLPREPGPEAAWNVVETVCVDCHNDVDLAGDMSLAGLTPESIPAHRETFEAVVHKLRGHLMPPPGSPELARADADMLIAGIEAVLDRDPPPTVGHVRAQRLTRTEYTGAIEGLLGVELDPVEFLPTEIEVEGFANIASALSVSPAFVEQSVGLVRTAAHLGVGEPVPKLAAAYFPPPTDSQQSYIDGFPLGTRGGTRFSHVFAADGEYRLTIQGLDGGLYPSMLQSEHTIVVLVDGEEALRLPIGGAEDLARVDRGGAPGRAEISARFTDIPLPLTAGRHEIVVTFIERSRGISDELIGGGGRGGMSYSGAARMPGIGAVNLVGPYGATGIATSMASRELIFVCQPELPAEERDCAERITTRFAERAFRRPITDEDLARLMPFFEVGRQGPGGFDEGIELVVTAVLASPDALYRTTTPPGDFAGEIYPLDDYELATRLSFFIWGQGPDDALLARAAAGELTDPDTLTAEAMRLLADPRAESLVANFALPWLDLDDLGSVVPDPAIFGEWSDALREDFASEIGLFVSSVLLGDSDVRALLDADYSFLNERLARHYGIDGVFGPQFRRVALEDPRRHGLLGKGAVLLHTSYGDRTSPVLRGAWILEKLMGTPPTPPPPGVETNLSTPPGEEPKTIRARLELHRTADNCRACHGAIDPWGLALENYTVTGRWRDFDREANAPIDASTPLPGGGSAGGPVDVTAALLERPDQFVQALTEKLMMYALGRELEYYDMPAVREIVRAAEREEYRFAALVAGVVASDGFRMQAVAQGEVPP